MIKKIKNNIWQLCLGSFESCVYLIKLKKHNLLIDTGETSDRFELMLELKRLGISISDIDTLILTHNHFDHTGNIDLFKNTRIYGSKEDFEEDEIEKLRDINTLKIPEIKIIKVPGHTKGSICLYMQKEKILFSGDTLFYEGGMGRTDFPNSSPEKMEESLEKLKKVRYKILCPGHVY